MEGDKTADNEKELTSTSSSDMDELLSTNNEEKNESNDTLPTSSTDASTSVKSTHLVSDDPISSTSSEMDTAKSKAVEKTTTDVANKASTFENDVEMLGMSMSRQPTERIEENVDDLVSDLETLLGESTASFSLPFKAADVQNKSDVPSAIEDNQQVILKDKSDNEVSSNTDASSDKNVNYGEPAAVQVENTDGESKQNKLSVTVEEAAKDIVGSNELEASTDSSAVKDSTEEPKKLVVPEELKEPDSDNIQNIQESSEDISEQDKEKVGNTNESEFKAISEEYMDDTSPKAAKDENAETCKDNENITAQDNVEKSDQLISTESVGDHVAEEPENSLQNQESTQSTPSEESAMRGSAQSKESELVEKQPVEDIQSKEYLEDPAKENEDNVSKDVQVASKEVAEIVMDPEEPSTICVQNIEKSHQLTETISAETVPSNETQNQCQENPESESSKSLKHEVDLQVNKGVTEDAINESVQQEQLNSSLEKQKVQSFDDKGSTSDDAIDLVQENNEDAEDANQSNKCASTEDSIQVLEEKTKVEDAIEDDDATKAGDVQIDETINTDEKMELIDTENGSTQSEEAHDLNILPKSSTVIMEEENVEDIAENSDAVPDINNELETENKKDDVSGIIDMSETADYTQETIAVESTETPKECDIKIEDRENCIKSQSEMADETFEIEGDEKSACSDKSQSHHQVETVDSPLGIAQAEIPKDLSESQGEDNCKSDKCAPNVSSPEPLKSDLENLQEISSEGFSEIPQLSKSPLPIHETEEPGQDNLKLPKEIEISDLAKTPTDADELNPVVEEPEETAKSASESVSGPPHDMEMNEDENKLPVITKDLERNHEDGIDIARTEKIDEDTTCVKSMNVEAIASSQNVPENSDEVIKITEIEDFKSIEKGVIERIKEDIAEDHLSCEVQGNDTSATITKETEDQMVVSDVELENIESNSGTQESTNDEHKIESDEKSGIPFSEPSDEVEESLKVLIEPQEIDSTKKEATEHLENTIDREKADSVRGKLAEETAEENADGLLVKESMEVIDGSLSRATDCQQVEEQNCVSLNSDLQKGDAKEVLSDTFVEACVNQNDTDALKGESYSEESAKIEEVIHEKKKGIISKTKLQEEVIGKTPSDVTEDLKNLITDNLYEEEQKLLPKEDVSFIPKDTNEGKKGKRKLEIFAQHIEEIKPIPEINIRRKTVEQDLEKVVCLSEESSSDSDTSDEINNPIPKLTADSKEADFEQDSLIHDDVPLTDDFPPNQEESDLIEIARKVEQLQKVETIRPIVSQISAEESTPIIEGILSNQRPDTLVDTEENLETILAVASLQNDPVCELKVERRLSEKELREMEAIRMAVASITDSSQDTYDSYLVESSMTMENSIPEVSSDIQEFSSDVQELSSDTQELSNDVQELCEDTEILAESVAHENTMEPNDDLEKEAISENGKDSKGVPNEGASNTKEADKTDMTETEVSDVTMDMPETEVSDVKFDMPETEVTDVKSDIAETEVSDVKTVMPETEVSDVKTDMPETAVSDVKTGMPETEVSDVKTDMPETEVSDIKSDMPETEVSDVNDIPETEVCDIKTDMPETEISDVKTDMPETEVSGVKTDMPETEVSDVKTDIPETEVSCVKTDMPETEVSVVQMDMTATEETSHNLADETDHPTSNDKDIEQIQYPTELKENLAMDNSREQAYTDDVDEQSKALMPDQTDKESEVKEIAASVSKQVVDSNETTEDQSVDRKESLKCEDNIVKQNTVTVSEPVITEEKVTTPLLAESQEIPIPENDAEEKNDTVHEPLVEKQDISKSEKCVKVEETAPPPIVDEGSISKSLQVVQEKEVALPAPVEEKKNLASKQVTKEKEIAPPKQAIEEKKVVASEQVVKEKKILTSEHIAQRNEVSTPQQSVEERTLRNRTRRGNKVSEPLSISVEEVEKKEKPYSPKITIKPLKVPDEEVSTTSDAEGNKGSLKITITKQSAKMHSILKVYNPDDDLEPPINQEEPIPKLIIKPKMQQVEQQHSPKMSTRSSKVYSPTSTQRCSSPRITIKPVVKPVESKTDVISPLKITFKPVVKPDESGKKHSPKGLKDLEQKNHSPKITIKPIQRPAESEREETIVSTPKVTIKPIKRHIEDSEADNEQERSSPKITIKPVVKPAEHDGEQANQTMPKLKIKPIKKHEDEENAVTEKDRDSPKISIKPIVKPAELEEDEEVKERIVLKINKGNLPTPSKDSRKREYPEDDKTEKIGKLKLKFSTTGGQTHIVQEVEDSFKRQRKDSGYSGKKDPDEVSNKRLSEDKLSEKNKRLRSSLTPDKVYEDGNDDMKIHGHKLDSPMALSEDSRSQHSGDGVILDVSQSNSSAISKIADIASRTTHIEASPVVTVGVVTPSLSPAPKRRGRPRKVPVEVRDELKELLVTPPVTPQVTPLSTPIADTSSSTLSEKSEPSTPVTTPSPGGRPKRSCRGQNVMATLGIKPRKPRGRGSGRGGKVNMGDREPVVQTSEGPVQTVAMKPEKEPKLTKAKLKLVQKAAEDEVKRQKEDAIKKEEEAEKVRQSEKEEEETKEEEGRALKLQEKELEKVNIELQKKQEEEANLKRQKEEEKQQKLAQQKPLEEGEKRKIFEENEKKQKALEEEEAKRLDIDREQIESVDKTQKELNRQKGIEEHKILEAEETARRQKEEAVKRKRDEGEGQSPPKKKKEDKTPPRKLEVTTRRQKAQLQKAADEAEKAAAEAQKAAAEAKNPVEAPEKLESSSTENNSISDTGIVISDENSSEIRETDKKIEERDIKPKEKVKRSPEQKGKGRVTPEKAKKLLDKAKLEEERKAQEAREAEEQAKADEQKKIEKQIKAEQEKAEEERRVAEEKLELERRELEKKELEQKELENKELEKKELEKKELEKKELEKRELVKRELEKKELEKRELDTKESENRELERIALEQKKAEQLTGEQEENEAGDKKEDIISADDKKPEDEATGDKKSEEVSAEEDEESEDSEGEKQRELVKQKKQEAIKKCRAKRMEKRAKAAEIKRKRQEQAAQQRAARIAAEEAERIAAEKSKINRRYGRYGNPKPQISLIDEPVRETEGTVKSHMGLFDPQTDQLMITQPIVIDDDSNFAGTQQSAEKSTSSSAQKLLAPPTPEPMAVDSTEETPTKHRQPIRSEDVMMVDEDTRMSADFRGASSRAQTPAKQSIPPPETIIEDSQGSIGTESVGGKSKSSKTPKMEVFQDLEAIQVSAEQLAEYSWNGRGPFMIQEQVALYLGIKSFKRKYPNCQRRSVDMQERDYLKENGYVTEAQCDLGLTAINAQDILDIMYADFQDKYEDYCKVQREKQARELANKQKALSQFTFKPGYEKLDIIEQAVQSAAAWNQQFNKTRREERKAHMDLQNLTVHYPKSKMKPVPVTKVGDHPIALVPGQFTDYYKEFTPTELNNLPLNTMCYDEIKVAGADSESDDDSGSESDSDSASSSDSSSSDSSCDEDCKECDQHGNAEVNDNEGNDVSMDNNGSNDSVVLVSVTAAPPVSV